MRKKIVATKEGGAITGEERIREKTTQLYGAITCYEGRPGDYQVARIDSLKHELDDVTKEFDAFAAKELTDANASLAKKKLARFTRSRATNGRRRRAIRTREAWRAEQRAKRRARRRSESGATKCTSPERRDNHDGARLALGARGGCRRVEIFHENYFILLFVV